jgi:hypothetical protein
VTNRAEATSAALRAGESPRFAGFDPLRKSVEIEVIMGPNPLQFFLDVGFNRRIVTVLLRQGNSPGSRQNLGRNQAFLMLHCQIRAGNADPVICQLY